MYKIKKNVNRLLLILPPLFIVLLVFSGRFSIPYINELLPNTIYIGVLFNLILIMFIFFYKIKVIRRKSLVFITLNLIFLIYITFRSFNKANAADNLILFELYLYVFPLIIFIFIFIKKKENNNMIILSMFLLTLLFGFIGLLSGGLGEQRISVLGGGSNVYGRYMVFGFTISFYYLIIFNNKLIKILMLVFLSMFLLLSVETGSRQAFIGIFIAILLIATFYTLHTVRNKKISIKILFLGASLLFILYYLIVRYVVDSLLWNRFMLLFESDKGGSVNARLMMIEKAKQMFYEAPLLGKGMGGFKEVTNSNLTYPHNIIYEILSEYGLIGILLFLFIIIYILFKSIKTIVISDTKNSSFQIMYLLLSLFILSFYFSLISGNIYDSRWIWFYGTLMINFSIIKGDKNNEKRKNVRFIKTI